tara:strand:- start:8060 stop:8947 length:888 start_codon:yes stop_codon:yes gene_type:complete
MILSFVNKRLSSGLAVGLFGLIIVLLGGWWFTLSLCLIVNLALLEFFRMSEFAGIRPATKTTLVACQILLLSTQLGIEEIISNDITAAVLPLSGAAICGWLLLQPYPGSIADIAASIFGLFYLGFLPSHWLRLRNILDINSLTMSKEVNINFFQNISFGTQITLISCLMIVAFDIGSYFVGRNFGRNPLSIISPGKTIEGAIGGFICSIIIGILGALFFSWKMFLLTGIILGSLIALFSLVGDLTESMMKRNAGIKDSGNALPGHGGILDRIDSYLFTPPIIYYTIILIFPLIPN